MWFTRCKAKHVSASHRQGIHETVSQGAGDEWKCRHNRAQVKQQYQTQQRIDEAHIVCLVWSGPEGGKNTRKQKMEAAWLAKTAQYNGLVCIIMWKHLDRMLGTGARDGAVQFLDCLIDLSLATCSNGQRNENRHSR